MRILYEQVLTHVIEEKDKDTHDNGTISGHLSSSAGGSLCFA